jgi:hypothetical protein
LQRTRLAAKLPGEHADHLMLDEVRDGKLVDGERLRQGKHGRAAKFEGRYPHIAVENNDHRLGFNVVLSVALVLPAPAFL